MRTGTAEVRIHWLPATRREDDVRTCLREMCCKDEKWIELALDRVHWQNFVLVAFHLGFCL